MSLPINTNIDGIGRKINYVRISLTDRCDMRCSYCMPINQEFLPKNEVLSFEEILFLIDFLCENGVNTIRLTGGEPLVRKNVNNLISSIGDRIRSKKLKELTITTNGTLLSKYADDLLNAGIKRINVSLDSINKYIFKKITYNGNLDTVINGIKYAISIGLKVKLNCVVLKNQNLSEIMQLIDFANKNNCDISFIETMPMGDDIKNREDEYVPNTIVKKIIDEKYNLKRDIYKTNGPSNYYISDDLNIKIGFISPLTHNFCDSCNRVRITATGKLYMCLGQDDYYDLSNAIKSNNYNELTKIYSDALKFKPKSHDFYINSEYNTLIAKPYTPKRNMSHTGG